VTPRYVAADPETKAGGRRWRRRSATSARSARKPLATTDNLNFGNPEKPEIMGQFVLALRGIGEACRALDMPIVSGNVSLYNETDGRAIPPTPTIGGVGLIADHATMLGIAPRDGDALVLIGETTGWLGQSALLADIFGREEGAPPPVDLAREAAHGGLVRALAEAGAVSAAHDLSDGGLAVAAAEMALAAGISAWRSTRRPGLAPLAWFFGEDQARYLLACADPAPVLEAAKAAGAPAAVVGRVGGDRVALGGADVPLETVRAAHAGGFARMMGEG
jgi:phosphoribosylformylglycinamidine (FGAM) synthase-like enzyme